MGAGVRRPGRQLGVMWMVVVAVLGGSLVTPAGAEVVEGRCSGVISLGDAVTVGFDHPRDVPLPVPAGGTFGFLGEVDRGPDDPDTIDYQGELSVLLPLGSVPLQTWRGNTSTAEVVGTGSFEVPSGVPGGTGAIPLELVFTAGDDRCVIVLGVVAPGPTWDVLRVLLVVVALLLLMVTAAAGRRDARGRGRPLTGLVSGLFAGAVTAGALFGVAAIPLDSAVWWLLPILLAVTGLLLGVTAPFGSGTRRADRTGSRPPHGPAEVDQLHQSD